MRTLLGHGRSGDSQNPNLTKKWPRFHCVVSGEERAILCAECLQTHNAGSGSGRYTRNEQQFNWGETDLEVYMGSQGTPQDEDLDMEGSLRGISN